MTTIALILLSVAVGVLAALFLKLRSTVMATQADLIAKLQKASDVIDQIAPAGTKIAEAVGAIQDAATKVVAALQAANAQVPQAVIDAIETIGQKAQDALASAQIISGAPVQLDEITSTLNAAATAANPAPAE